MQSVALTFTCTVAVPSVSADSVTSPSIRTAFDPSGVFVSVCATVTSVGSLTVTVTFDAVKQQLSSTSRLIGNVSEQSSSIDCGPVASPRIQVYVGSLRSPIVTVSDTSAGRFAAQSRQSMRTRTSTSPPLRSLTVKLPSISTSSMATFLSVAGGATSVAVPGPPTNSTVTVTFDAPIPSLMQQLSVIVAA